MPIVPLSSLATVRMGVTLRGRDATRPDPNGSFSLIQISDLEDDGTFRNPSSQFTRIEPNEPLNYKLILQPGDILFPNRGVRTTAVVFNSPGEKAVAGAQFFILRPESQKIIPEYLAWTLRTTEAALYFSGLRKGTLVQTLQRFHLDEFPVPLPALAVQRKILKIDNLQRESRILESRLAELRAIHLERSLLNTAQQA
ncbi:MAG: restriction endonuclease subunit S [Luteolibacter sp.]